MSNQVGRCLSAHANKSLACERVLFERFAVTGLIEAYGCVGEDIGVNCKFWHGDH